MSCSFTVMWKRSAPSATAVSGKWTSLIWNATTKKPSSLMCWWCALGKCFGVREFLNKFMLQTLGSFKIWVLISTSKRTLTNWTTKTLSYDQPLFVFTLPIYNYIVVSYLLFNTSTQWNKVTIILNKLTII